VSELIKRTLTGLIFITIIIGAILWNKFSVGIIFLLISIFGLIEFFKLMEKAGFKPKKSIVSIVGAVIYSILFLYSLDPIYFKLLFILFPLLVLIVALELFRKNETPISNIAFSIMGILYVVVPFALLNFFAYGNSDNTIIKIVSPNHPAYLLLGFFIIQWSCDTGAYLAGSTIGKTKLFPTISPNKTWEGFIGGMALSILIAYLISLYTNTNSIHWIGIATIVVLFGTLGDLTESQIKRSSGAKDSGSLLPGHGGFLDRFDGVLFSAPFVLAYLHIVDLFKLFI
tara:strand:+ start:171 stop:1025 length:855 start_codon:yes stop_codon:yes gene_type:complete